MVDPNGDDEMLVTAKATLFLAALQSEGFPNELLVRGVLQALKHWLDTLPGDAVEKVIEFFTERACDRVGREPEELDLDLIVRMAWRDVDAISKRIPD